MFQQFEILMEGFNPAATGPLTDAELSAARNAMQPGEHLGSFVRGRTVSAGNTLWVLTESAVWVLQSGRRRSASRLNLTDVSRITLERGRYGTTLALYTAGQRVAVFGADEALARVFAAAFTQAQPAAAASIEAPSKACRVQQSDAADVATWVSWSRLRLMPTAQGMAENLGLLREAASLHQSGMLNDAEFDALKGRLLDVA